MSENDKDVPFIVCDTLFERGDFKVSIRNFESGKSLGRKVHFFSTSLGQPKFPGVSNFETFSVF